MIAIPLNQPDPQQLAKEQKRLTMAKIERIKKTLERNVRKENERNQSIRS